MKYKTSKLNLTVEQLSIVLTSVIPKLAFAVLILSVLSSTQVLAVKVKFGNSTYATHVGDNLDKMSEHRFDYENDLFTQLLSQNKISLSKVTIANEQSNLLFQVPESALAPSELLIDSLSAKLFYYNSDLHDYFCQVYDSEFSLMNNFGVSYQQAIKFSKSCRFVYFNKLKSSESERTKKHFKRIYFVELENNPLFFTSWTSLRNRTFFIITPTTTISEFESMFIHEFFITHDKKYLQSFNEFIIDNNISLNSIGTNFKDAFAATQSVIIAQTLSVARAFLFEKQFLTAPNKSFPMSHFDCRNFVENIFHEISSHFDSYIKSSSEMKDSLNLNQDENSQLLNAILSEKLVIPLKDKPTLCQYLIAPQLGDNDKSFGPRPVIRPGGWISDSLTNSANNHNIGLPASSKGVND